MFQYAKLTKSKTRALAVNYGLLLLTSFCLFNALLGYLPNSLPASLPDFANDFQDNYFTFEITDVDFESQVDTEPDDGEVFFFNYASIFIQHSSKQHSFFLNNRSPLISPRLILPIRAPPLNSLFV